MLAQPPALESNNFLSGGWGRWFHSGPVLFGTMEPSNQEFCERKTFIFKNGLVKQAKFNLQQRRVVTGRQVCSQSQKQRVEFRATLHRRDNPKNIRCHKAF